MKVGRQSNKNTRIVFHPQQRRGLNFCLSMCVLSAKCAVAFNVLEPKSFADPAKIKCGCPRLPSIDDWIVVLLELVEKVDTNQTSDFGGWLA
jgi:hypothetical protein